MRLTSIDRAIAALEAEKHAIDLAIAKLKLQRDTKPARATAQPRLVAESAS